MTANMPTWISDTIGALMSWMRQDKVDELRIGLTHKSFVGCLFATAPEWIERTISGVRDWMRGAGVTEIIITQEGATWR